MAIYSVALRPNGTILSVVLVQSSGTAAFDQAGEQMIRTTMHFPPSVPDAQGDGTGYFSVSLRFTPDKP